MAMHGVLKTLPLLIDPGGIDPKASVQTSPAFCCCRVVLILVEQGVVAKP